METDVDKFTHLTEEEKKRLNNISNPAYKEGFLRINDFIKTYNETCQELTEAEFKKYLPLYNEEQKEKYIKERGPRAYTDMATEFYTKVSPYKSINIIDNRQQKKILYTLPPAAVRAPSIEMSDEQARARALNSAIRKMRNTENPRIANEGHMEYQALMGASMKTDAAIRHFAHARLETDRLTDQLRDLRKGVGIKTENQPKEEAKLTIDEDDEVYD